MQQFTYENSYQYKLNLPIVDGQIVEFNATILMAIECRDDLNAATKTAIGRAVRNNRKTFRLRDVDDWPYGAQVGSLNALHPNCKASLRKTKKILEKGELA